MYKAFLNCKFLGIKNFFFFLSIYNYGTLLFNLSNGYFFFVADCSYHYDLCNSSGHSLSNTIRLFKFIFSQDHNIKILNRPEPSSSSLECMVHDCEYPPRSSSKVNVFTGKPVTKAAQELSSAPIYVLDRIMLETKA